MIPTWWLRVIFSFDSTLLSSSVRVVVESRLCCRIVLGWRMLALLLCRVRWRIELDAKPYSCASAWPFFCRRTVEPRMRVSSGLLLLKLLSISPLQSFCFFFVFFFNLLLDRETNEGFFCYVLRGWDFCRFGWRFKVAPLWFLEVAVDSWSCCGFLEEVV